MKTEEEVYNFLESLQWERCSKKDLQRTLQRFFETENEIEDATDEDAKNVDYSIIFTNQNSFSSSYIDVEIWYLKMRNGNILITGTELLCYVE